MRLNRYWVCVIAKKEHLYINEFVKYYVDLGFGKIVIYDNDELSEKRIETFIDRKYHKYIKVISIRGLKEDRLQQKIYTKFYNENKYLFDWCLFCDVDEYLVGINKIEDMFDELDTSNIDQIRIKWRLFGDDNLIERDMSKTLIETFTQVKTKSLNRNLIDKGTLENQGKCMVKGGLQRVVFTSAHFCSYVLRNNIAMSSLPSGRSCNSKVVIKEDYSNETIYLNHYMTKSLKEFINQKLNRHDLYDNNPLSFNYFWRINDKTQEKLDYIRSLGFKIN